MLPTKRARTQGAAILDESAIREDLEAKREMARRLLEGDGVDKDEAKAVSLLEDCVAHGDTDAMVMLAKCCALGRGVERNAERADALVSEAAKKGNDEARILLKLINDWKGEESIYLWSLRYVLSSALKENVTFVLFFQTVSKENARLSV
jgi:TPR repeat protein